MRIIGSWHFDVSAQTLTLDNYNTVSPELLELVVNLTTGKIIFDRSAGHKVTRVLNNVFYLEFDVANMANGDALHIAYNDRSTLPAATGFGVTTEAVTLVANTSKLITPPAGTAEIRIYSALTDIYFKETSPASTSDYPLVGTPSEYRLPIRSANNKPFNGSDSQFALFSATGGAVRILYIKNS